MSLIDELLCFSDSDAPAYRCAEGLLTYRELLLAAKKLAGLLLEMTTPGAPVAIYGHKQRLMPVCMVACALANRPYLPIDRKIPAIRARRMLESSGAGLLLSVGEGLSVPIPTLNADAIRAALRDPGRSPAGPEPVHAAPQDPFYLLFTSGSNGAPKGVIVTRANVASFLRWERGLLQSVSGPVLNHAAFSFDLSVADLWLALTSGRCEAALEDSLFGDYPALFSQIDVVAPTLAVLTPSFAELLLASPSFCAERYPTLRELLFCGETLRWETVERLWGRFPSLRIVNSYGPTECTVAVTGCVVTREMPRSRPVPIGLPKPDVSIMLTDAALFPLQIGEPGELVVVGESVAAGYLGGEQGGFCTIDNRPAYRTGDLGFFQNGLFYCMGRRDRQFKWRGVRIEPGDIEQNLLRVEGVTQAAVLPLRRPDGRVRRLRAFATLLPESDPAIDEDAIRKTLRALLPQGMIPATVTILPHMPLTPNGKCDYAALEVLP